jgi:hypothetical protein
MAGPWFPDTSESCFEEEGGDGGGGRRGESYES